MEVQAGVFSGFLKNIKLTAKGKQKQKLYLLIMALPFIVQVIIFNYVPVWGWLMAFVDYIPGIPVLKCHFAGLKYFTMLFSGGSQFMMVMRNTLVLSFLGLLTTPLPVALAILITECRGSFFKRFVQMATSLPNFISWVITYSIFFNFLSFDDGVINVLFLKLHIFKENINFLANENMVWPLQTFISIWKSLGWSAIIFISAIAGIDQELYQAAEIDGAGRFRKILHVTIPGIMSTFVIILVLSVGSILSNGFEQYYMFKNSMVNDYITTLDIYVINQGIVYSNYSFATAVGIFKTVVSIFLLLFINKVSRVATGKAII